MHEAEAKEPARRTTVTIAVETPAEKGEREIEGQRVDSECPRCNASVRHDSAQADHADAVT